MEARPEFELKVAESFENYNGIMILWSYPTYERFTITEEATEC